MSEIEYKRIFVWGVMPKILDHFGLKSPHVLRRVALSGGVGLTTRNEEIYEYMWIRQRRVFTRDFQKWFRKNDQAHIDMNV